MTIQQYIKMVEIEIPIDYIHIVPKTDPKASPASYKRACEHKAISLKL